MKVSVCAAWYRRTFIAALAVGTALVFAPLRAHAQCAGDCDGSGDVTVNEVVTLVNIALGTEDPSACPQGIPDGAAVEVTLVVQAVNNALVGCAGGGRLCGNGTVDTGEDCDNGGTCIGGSNAGTACTADGQCQGDGVCLDGTKNGWGCSTNADCPNSECIRCKTFGGQGCAANCTTESDVNITLVPGDDTEDPTKIKDGTSGLVVSSAVGITVAIPYVENTVRQLTIGKEKDGKIPIAVKEATNQIAGIDVLGGSACICLRPVVMKTCGGTLWEKDGTPSTDCSEGYTAGDSVCAASKPCTFTYGPGNGGAGVTGCESLDGVNVTSNQDHGGSTGVAGPVVTTRSDVGGAGSAVVDVATELGFIVGQSCTGADPDYGQDGQFCTADDPKAGRGVLPQVLTTGIASSTITNANFLDPSCDGLGFTNCQTNADCGGGEVCLASDIGPITAHGAPLSCSALASGNASGGALASGFPDLDAPTVMDIVVTTAQVAQ
jgi:hypothetical protein